MGVMNRPLGDLVPGMLKQKKGVTLIVGVAMVLFGERWGIEIDPELRGELVKLIMAYLVGQGIADLGKGKALLELVPPLHRRVKEKAA